MALSSGTSLLNFCMEESGSVYKVCCINFPSCPWAVERINRNTTAHNLNGLELKFIGRKSGFIFFAHRVDESYNREIIFSTLWYQYSWSGESHQASMHLACWNLPQWIGTKLSNEIENLSYLSRHLQWNHFLAEWPPTFFFHLPIAWSSVLPPSCGCGMRSNHLHAKLLLLFPLSPPCLLALLRRKDFQCLQDSPTQFDTPDHFRWIE